MKTIIVFFVCECGNRVITEAKARNGKLYRDAYCIKCQRNDPLNDLILAEVKGGIGSVMA
jgi:hypothetical protein